VAKLLIARLTHSLAASKKSLMGVAVLIALFSQLLSPISPAQAALSTVTKICRSTDGTGTTLESNAIYNGYYQASGIKIVPVYSKRMYVDLRNNFNATYIGYKVTNLSGATINNLVVELTGFTGGVVSPATANDTSFTIGTLANSASKTTYFFVKATGSSAVDQRHDVRVSTDDGVTKTEKAACYTNIQAVQRSLSASANKVTSITTSTSTPALGQTMTVTVIGAPGNVGAGELPDNSIVAMSPASYASWPTKALRLESVELTIKGLTNAAAGTCSSKVVDFNGDSADPANVEAGSGSLRSVTIKERLVIRSATSCVPNTKQTYEAKYVFRVVGIATTNPVIVPLASISSGTQIKYTGTLPATQTAVNLTATTYPVTVQKTFVSSAVSGSNVDLTYRITASGVSGSLDELRDDPQSGFSFVSATFTDATRTSPTSITPTNIGTTGDPLFRFLGPFTTTSLRPLVLTYVLRTAIPTSNSNFSNYGYGMVAGVEIGNQTTVSGISAEITNTGGVTTTSLSAKTPQVISFTAKPTMGVDAQQTLTGYSDSGLPLTYTSLTPTTCVVSELNGVWTLTAIGEGACQVKASQAGDNTFDPATDVIVNVTVLKGQVITPSNTAFAGSPATATVTVYSTSTYLVTLVSVDTSICTVNASPVVSSTGNKQAVYTITRVGSSTGTCVLTASQAGDTGANPVWGPAPDVDILIGIGSAQNLAFTSPAANASYNYSASTNITVVVSSYVGSAQTTKTGLPVALRSATPSVCTLITTIATDGTIDSGYNSTSKDTTLSFKMVGAGTCTVIASQDGIDDLGAQSIYAMASEISRSFTIVASGSTAQTLTFDSITSKTYGDSSFPVYVSSVNPSSVDTTLLVTISSTTTDVCIVGSSTRSAPKSTATLYMLSGGTCSLKGTQAGNTDYAAATTTTSFTVNKKQLTISGLTIPSREYNGTKTATIYGTPGLDGVVPGDTADDIDHTGTPVSADFSSAAAVTSESLTVTGITTTGTKKDSSYTLGPLSLNGSITTRAITYRFNALSIGSSDSTTCSPNVSISAGTLAAGETLNSIACNPSTLSGSSLGTGTWPVTPQNAVIKTSSNVDTSANYSVTYLAGDLTVEAVAIPVVSADDLTVYYGELTSAALGSSALTSVSGIGVRAVSRSSYVAGSISHTIGGSSIPVDLAVGDHTVDVAFTPANPGAYGNSTTHRVIHVLPRHITYQVAQVDDKEYDGNTDAVVSGSTSLIAQPEQDGLGVLAGDEADLVLVGTQTATFDSAGVGTAKSVTLGGLTLSGAKSSNYVLHQPAATTASITQRHITVSFNSGSLAPGESTDCLSEVSVTAGTLVSGETLDAVDCSPATLSEAALGAGSWLITPSNGVIKAGSVAKTSNYSITYVAHHLSVTSLVVPALETDELTVYYGDLTAAQLGSSAQTNGSSNGVRAKDGTTFVPGSISHSYNGAAIPEDLPVGDYTVDVDFTPSSPGTYTGKSGHRVIHVLKRHLTYIPGTIADKEYDGNTDAAISGTGSLIAQPGEDGFGVLAGDTADLGLTGTQTGVFTDANVGTGKQVTVTGLSLTGSKRNNYVLHEPATRTAAITQRHITLTFGAVSIGPGESTTCLPNINLTAGTFVSGESLAAIDCSPSTLSSDALGVGSWRIDPSNAVIKAGTTDKTSNYSITYVGHNLTVSALDVPDIDADPVTVYYGELTASQLGSATQDNGLSNGVRATHGPNYVAGAITHKYNGAAIPEDLPVGDYLIDVEFTPTNSGAYAGNNGHRVVHVLPRHLTYSFGTVANKEYDGTTDAVISGSSSLVAQPGRDGLGVLAADAADVELTGTTEAAFATATVGESKSVTVTGLSLGGSKRANYVLHQPAAVTAKITKRDAHVTIPVLDKDYDGTTAATLDCDSASISGLVAGDIPDLDLACGYSSANFASAEAGVRTISYVGSAPTLVDKPTKSKAVNYRVVVSTLVATINKVTPTITIAAITSPQAGQRVSVVARSNMLHKPVVITVTGNPVGACTISGTSITAVAEGTCTVEASQESDSNHFAASNINTFNISAASVTPSPTPSPEPTILVPSTPSPTPSVTPTTRPIVPSPTPIPLTSATPTPRATPSPTPTPSVTPRPTAPAVPAINAILEAVAKIIEQIVGTDVVIPETGAGIEGKADVIIEGKPAAVSVAVKTLDEAADYRNAGYQGGTGSRIEVIGSRIAGQFVVAPGGALDAVAIAAAIEESTARNKTDFAQIDSVVNVTPPDESEVYKVDIDENHRRIFSASGLKEPVSLASIDTSKSTKWISVEASADTYLPGSRVYLTVTTDPIVFAEAVVDKYGKAHIQGNLPIDLLEAGGHSIRVVGVRSLDGVTTRDDGSIVLNQTALDEIQKFDDATMATVLISGETRAGGNRTSVLEIPLDRQVSWWALWLAIATSLLALGLRFIKGPAGARRKTVAILVALVGGIPAAVLGWIEISYELWIGVIISVLVAGALILLSRRRKSRRLK
jgi:hypothetical protein